jgi:succinate dehydrogenase / fumarate reductase flavoprotein subunit
MAAQVHQFDVIVIGAGGAGMMAALYASRGAKTAVISKLYPTRSHTGTAQGGVGAALGNLEEDRWEWHAFDTVKGGDYLSDQNAAEVLARDAIRAVIELEHMGLPFDRTDEGRISQRRFGGHTNNETGKPVRRACHAADRTGHMILQTLYQNCIKEKVTFFDEFHAVDLIMNEGQACGVVAIQISTGELHVFHAKAVCFATGGWGRCWQITSNAHSLTGDGPAIFLRRGLPMEDMEFYQIHPTGIYKLGILITEGVRGEGGVLLNDKGERFMEKYAPKIKDLASRDVVSRAIYTEIRAGNGIGGKDYVYLDIRPDTVNRYLAEAGETRRVTPEEIESKLPDIADFCRTYLGVDPIKEPMPIQPTAHYAMGGIPTNIDSEVISTPDGQVVAGLYAAGEVACVSVHGANRLGTNSLTDLIVFGRRAGMRMLEFAKQSNFVPLPPHPEKEALAELERIRQANGSVKPFTIRDKMQHVMMDGVGVYRNEEGMKEALATLQELRNDFQTNLSIDDRGQRFNTDVLEAWELGALLDCAIATANAALARQESRGGHCREDFPNRDDVNFLRHSFVWQDSTPETVDFSRAVDMSLGHQPKERVY